MRRRNFLLPTVAFVGLILFFCFLTRLLLLRYERGDVYPSYSTLRVDPLGTRAFYEALETLDSYSAARGYTSLHRELNEKPSSLFYLGLDSGDVGTFTKDEIAQLDTYVKNGGRVVITFQPEMPSTASPSEPKKPSAKKTKTDSSKKDPVKPDATPEEQPPEAGSDQNATEPQTEQEKYEREEFRKETEDSKDDPDKKKVLVRKYNRSLAALWGFGWKLNKGEEKEKKKTDTSSTSASSDSSTDSSPPKAEETPEVLAFRSDDKSLELSVPWDSALYFVRLEPDWQVLYKAKTEPVLIRRVWGKGEIIVATDSYLISNEALSKDRCPALLSALAGPPGKMLFDETHLGTQEQEGIMYLAEKFRLEGYLYGMVGVLLLFLWRNSVPLVPPRPTSRQALLGGAVSGKDSRSGLVNLLRRNIPMTDILKTSLTEWKRNVAPTRRDLQGKASQMESTLTTEAPINAEQIVQSYHKLREINAPRRTKGNYATKS